MSTGPLRVLLIEDSEADADLVRHEFERTGMDVRTERVDSRDSLTRALGEFAPDVVLTDHTLSQLDPSAAFEAVQSLRPTAPLIIVARALDEEMAVACLRAGADDFVLKGNLGRLGPAIEAAMSVRRRLYKLTPRQLEVLRLVAEGRTSPEIAQRLRLSVKTVETHRGEIMKRLGIHDVVGLVRYAVRVRLVSSEG